MDLVLLFLGVLVLLALPVGIYWLRVKPGVTGEARGMVIVGACMAASMLVPMVGMPALFMGVVWKVAVTVLLVAHGAVWLLGAVRKRTPYLLGAAATGVTVAISSALIGNWICLAVALIYLGVLVRYRLVGWNGDL